MKKLLLFIFLAVPSLLWAQSIEETTNGFKPVAGEKTIELQLRPFGDYPININGLRLRSFVTSTQARRLNVFLSVNSNSDIIQQANPDFNLQELKSTNSAFNISVSPGMEYHLKGTERISPYYGWEGNIAFRQSSVKTESQNGDEVNYTRTINPTTNPGYFRLGANVLAGLDIYIIKKLYLGTELSFGASYTNYLSTRTTSDAPGFTQPEPVKRGHAIGLGLNVNTQIRLGYAF